MDSVTMVGHVWVTFGSFLFHVVRLGPSNVGNLGRFPLPNFFVFGGRITNVLLTSNTNALGFNRYLCVDRNNAYSPFVVGSVILRGVLVLCQSHHVGWVQTSIVR